MLEQRTFRQLSREDYYKKEEADLQPIGKRKVTLHRYIALIILAIGLTGSTQAQKRISHEYNNVSLSEALNQLAKQQTDYAIMFLYNELEDFRITTTVSHKPLPDAIRQMVGLYPIRVTVDTSDPKARKIFVECTHKTDRHLTGVITDEQGQPIAYANIAILNPIDSTLLSGGVSNESGYFAIPYERERVLARISYVGYKTIYKICNQPEVGTIRLQPDSYELNGVTVRGEIPQYRATTGGVTVEVQHSILKDVGTASDLLSMLPNVQGEDGNYTVFAKGVPEIYINNKKVQNGKELRQLKSTDIKSVDIITSPGAKYDAEVYAVIRIRTIRPQGDGLSVEAFGQIANNEKWTTYDDMTVKYRQHGLEVFGTLTFYNNHHSEDNNISSDTYAYGNHISIRQYAPSAFWFTDPSGEIGASYDMDAENSIGIKYGIDRSLYMGGKANCTQAIYRNGALEGMVDQWMGTTESDGPVHEANVYYIGKIGKLGIDFNGSWLWNKKVRNDVETERSQQLEDRDIHLRNEDHRNMLAGKLVVSYPIWKGELSIGSEMTRTHSTGTNENEEHYVKSSDDDIKEQNQAGFAEYNLHLGNWRVDGGIRYEHVITECRSFGVYQEEPSRRYSDWFPNLSVAWQKGKWGAEASYNKRIRRPAYYAISSYVQYDNRYQVEGGNPLLCPTIRQDFDLRLSYSWMDVSVGYTRNRDIFFSFGSLYEPGSEVVIWNRQNFKCHQAYHASVTASPKFGCWQPTLTFSYWQQHFPSTQSGVNTSLNKPDCKIDLRNWFVIDETMKAMLYLHYGTSNDYGFTREDSKFNVDLRLQKTFLNNRLTAIIFAKDIFKTLRDKWVATYPIATMGKDAYLYTRCIGVSLSYHLNTTRSKYKGTGAGNDEKNRL